VHTLNDLETVKDAFSKKNKQIGKIASEKRVIVFRDEEYAIDVKSHFIDIEPKIDFGVDEFISAILTAIKKQKDRYSFVSTEEKEDIKIENTEVKTKVKTEIIDELEEVDEDEVDEAKNKELIKTITTHYKTATADKKKEVKEILEDNGATKFDITLPTRVFTTILDLFK
jgi:hypothetical protein